MSLGVGLEGGRGQSERVATLGLPSTSKHFRVSWTSTYFITGMDSSLSNFGIEVDSGNT